MGKQRSLKSQLKFAVLSNQRYGQSKHSDKKNPKVNTQEGVYSISSAKALKDTATNFSNFMRTAHSEVKEVRELKVEHFNEWIDSRQRDWSDKTYESSAIDNSVTLNANIYEFDEKSEYPISNDTAVNEIEIHRPLGGKLVINGDFTESTASNDIPTYIVRDDCNLSLSYSFKDSPLLNNDDTSWHIVSDSKKSVNDVKLDDKIGKVAIIFQTSLDGKKWFVNGSYLNFAEKETDKKLNTNDIQLVNGCYYRLIVVYKVEKEIEKKFINETVCHKYAEMYEFYASYDQNKYITPANEKKFSLGKLVNTGKANGYSGNNEIVGNDPHYGWEIGNFFISGYTEKTDDEVPVFMKNAGDKVSLYFNLNQDINKLNGNKDLSIIEDKAGYDQYFQTQPTNFKHGALIIRKTDHEGVKSEPIIYTDYLAALPSIVLANTFSR